MSNNLAVATVTATLQHLLQNYTYSTVPGTTIKVGQPKPPPATDPAPEINISLYQVTPNIAYRNADLPARNSTGILFTQPRLALDLHYLLSFYGDEQQLEPQRLLGLAAQTLHVYPILTRGLINEAVSALSGTYPFLSTSNLASETIEQIKMTPQAISIEELARLWSTFFQTIPYSLSIAYVASVVLIDGQEIIAARAPVETLNIKMAAMPPVHKAQAVSFIDTDNDPDEFGGTISITPAADERDITHYALYWGANATTKISGRDAIALLPKTGNEITHILPANTYLPAGATHLLVFTRNGKAEMKDGVSTRIKDVVIFS